LAGNSWRSAHRCTVKVRGESGDRRRRTRITHSRRASEPRTLYSSHYTHIIHTILMLMRTPRTLTETCTSPSGLPSLSETAVPSGPAAVPPALAWRDCEEDQRLCSRSRRAGRARRQPAPESLAIVIYPHSSRRAARRSTGLADSLLRLAQRATGARASWPCSSGAASSQRRCARTRRSTRRSRSSHRRGTASSRRGRTS